MSERWEVFGKRTAAETWQAVGAVHAPDEDMALLFAKESFFRHGEGVDVAVVRTRDFHVLDEPDLLRFHTDKTYKLQEGYPLGDKRRRATEHARALGLVVERPRPQDRRAPTATRRPSEGVETS
jgi:ring-1,2-phenylacetyl-CoA epoxidase subunit PaaB